MNAYEGIFSMSTSVPRIQPCPSCGMPRLAEAMEHSPCPLCAETTPGTPARSPSPGSPTVDPYAHLPADASVLYTPPPPSSPHLSPRWSGRALIIAFAIGALLGGLTVAVFPILFSDQTPQEKADTLVLPVPSLAQVTPSTPPVASATASASSPSSPTPPPSGVPSKSGKSERRNEPEGESASPLSAPGERSDLGGTKKPATPELPPLPPPLRQERFVARLEQPHATYTVPDEWLQPGNIIVLRGQVRELRIPRLPLHVQLEARELTARSIYVGGERLEMVRLHLHAPEGTIAFRTVIGQGTRLHLDAPGGSVRFGGINPWQPSSVLIHQGAQVYVRARQLQVDGVVRDPQTRLLMDWTPPARLQLHAVEQGAQVLYRRTVEGDNARIEAHATIVDPSATFRATEN